MDPLVLMLLSSGLFLGWSLGANDAANVFGTAVGTRMVRWRTAAAVCAVFVVLGAVCSGAGTTASLSRLGAVTDLSAAFVVALAAGLAVYAIVRTGVPTSTSQAVFGAVLGWNLHMGQGTNAAVIREFVTGWVAGPLLAAGLAIALYRLSRWAVLKLRLHLLTIDSLTRSGLILVGAFGAYALGANNVANVVGMFMPARPLPPLALGGWEVSPDMQLLLLGGLAIAAGVVTYSHRVMITVGATLGRLTALRALAAVLAHSIVLMLFAAPALKAWLEAHGLPGWPVVPVSSSQLIIGAIIGLSLEQGLAGVRWSLLGRIVLGWLITPVLAGLLSILGLLVVLGRT